jgi:hypothetical protein
MDNNDPLLTAMAALSAQMSSLNTEIRFLSEQVNELKGQNEARRNSIDSVALSLRGDCAAKTEALRLALNQHGERLSAIDQKLQVGQWLVVVIGGAVISLVASKLFTLTLSPDHFPKPENQSHATGAEFSALRITCLPNCEQTGNWRTV